MFINVPPRPQGHWECEPAIFRQVQQPHPVAIDSPHQYYTPVDPGSKYSLETQLLAQFLRYQNIAPTQHSMAFGRNTAAWPKSEPVLNMHWGSMGDVADDKSLLVDDDNGFCPPALQLSSARHSSNLSLRPAPSRRNTNISRSRPVIGRELRVRSSPDESAYWPTLPTALPSRRPFVPGPEHFFDGNSLNGLPAYNPQSHVQQSAGPTSFLLPLLPASSPLSSLGSFSSTGASELIDSIMLEEPDHSPLSVSSTTSRMLGGPNLLSQPTDDWGAASHPMETTVSPKMLRLRPSPTPNSSTESFQTNFVTGESLEGSSFPLANYDSDPAVAPVRPSPSDNPPHPKPKPRKQLPDKPRYMSLQPKAEKPPSSSTKSSGRSSRASKHKSKTPAPSRSRASVLPSMTIAQSERSAKDDFLVQNKRAGMTYKEIRRKGGFTEAESTLRGRYRTLTKNKEARVRKPEWSEEDLYLLDEGVRSLARGEDLRTAKVPWKQVAEYIYNNGGSYLFGNSTCRKRWDDLVAEKDARDREDNLDLFYADEEAGKDGESRY